MPYNSLGFSGSTAVTGHGSCLLCLPGRRVSVWAANHRGPTERVTHQNIPWTPTALSTKSY